jgi:hypothetical protein
MNTNNITAKEAVLLHKAEMEAEFPFDYFDLISDGGDSKIDEIYQSMLDKKLLY